MGEPPDRLLPTSATMSAVNTVQGVKEVQSKYWQSMFPKGVKKETKNVSIFRWIDYLRSPEPVDGLVGGARLHGSDVICISGDNEC